MELLNVAAIAEKAAGLGLFILHGSRARNQHRPDSDWDFAYLATPAFDSDALLGRLSEELGDAVDLADLSRASALLRFKAAAHGVLVYQAQPGLWATFRMDAIATWCDMEPVLTKAYDVELSRLAQ